MADCLSPPCASQVRRQIRAEADTTDVMEPSRQPRRGEVTGDARADRFAALFRTHYAAVWRFTARRAAPDAVDDVVADTFLAAWRRFDELPADTLPWLLNAAGKCLANHRRSASRAESLTQRLAAEPAGAPPDPTARGDQRQALVRAFHRLSDDEREVLLLADWDGLPAGRIARVLGISAATASARIYRARKKLRRALAAELERGSELTLLRSAT
jgi:RNA polymerase sigma-70 factor (ECF subfamily)